MQPTYSTFITNHSQSQGMQEIIYPHKESQRVDNFLFAKFRKIPKPLIYRLIRKRNIKLNGKNIKPFDRVNQNDILKIPSFLTDESNGNQLKTNAKRKNLKKFSDKLEKLEKQIIYQDEFLVIFNKPTNLAVHQGSSIDFGLIECLNQKYPDYELAHRLDKKTTGCLIVAKNRKIAKKIHQIFREKKIKKHYLALCYGYVEKKIQKINLPLYKKPIADLRQKVEVNFERGKESITYIRKVDHLNLNGNIPASLLEIEIKSGRTHQIRVHLAHLHHPIIGDDRYYSSANEREKQKTTKQSNSLKNTLSNTFMLHCHRLVFNHPVTNQKIEMIAKPAEAFDRIIQSNLKK